MVFKDDQKNQERALITLASISLKAGSPSLAKFYHQDLIARLFAIVRLYANKVSYYALDSIR